MSKSADYTNDRISIAAAARLIGISRQTYYNNGWRESLAFDLRGNGEDIPLTVSRALVMEYKAAEQTRKDTAAPPTCASPRALRFRTQPCPYCERLSSVVRYECKHCGEVLPAVDGVVRPPRRNLPSRVTAATGKAANLYIPCWSCGSPRHRRSLQCPHCRAQRT